jgi:predicted dehydrogenase
LARSAEEHSGPHEPWFWQGGGVLSDMMCHSVEMARFMLTAPGATRDSLRLVSASATAANLKWTRPRYAADLKTRMGIDFAKRPVEDFARGILALEDADGQQLDDRSDDVMGLCRRRVAHPDRAARSGILDGVLVALDRPQGISLARGHRI